MRAAVNILSNRSRVCVYTGMTGDLAKRIWEHKIHVDPRSFTARYRLDRLVYYEMTDDITAAIAREKQIKSWNRAKRTP